MTCPTFPRTSPLQLRDSTAPPKALMGPVAILWDIENCPVPGDVHSDDVAGNIRTALKAHPAVEGSVTVFSAYGDFNHFPRRLREGCQRTGINLIDVPNGKKDVSDKAILVDMFLFALDNPPPSTILLISGDVDFAPALHKLGQRGYTVVIAIPARVGVASALCNAGQHVWDWPSVARGEGFVPTKALLGRLKFGDNAVVGLSNQSGDELDHLIEDENCRHHGSPPYAFGNAMLSQNNHGIGACVRGHPPHCSPQNLNFPCHQPNRTYESVRVPQNENINFVGNDSGRTRMPLRDLQGLKNQLIKLLKNNGGELDFVHVPAVYSKMFGRPLYVAEYGSLRLAHLFERMRDVFVLINEGGRRKLCLLECIPPATQRLTSEKKDAGTRGQVPVAEDDADLLKEVILFGAHNKEQKAEASSLNETVKDDTSSPKSVSESALKLDVFKQELRELLVSHSCRMPLQNFFKYYQQRYTHDLDIASLGEVDVEHLLETVRDVAVVAEEHGTKRKFLIANGSWGHKS